MKLLLENWRKYLLTEQSELWGHQIAPDQKVFISKEPYTNFRNTVQKTPDNSRRKPAGLWYACGDEWIEWTKSEMPEWLESSDYLYEVKLGDGVLRITNAEEFEWLEQKYLRPGRYNDEVIDWKAIQDDGYSGIEICPYQSHGRYGSEWYYGWDVASGCIWDSSGIAEINLIAERPTGEKDDRAERTKRQERIKELETFKEKVKKATEENGCGDWFYRSDYMEKDWESIDPEEMSEEEFMKKLADHVMDNCGFDIEKWY